MTGTVASHQFVSLASAITGIVRRQGVGYGKPGIEERLDLLEMAAPGLAAAALPAAGDRAGIELQEPARRL